jgi:hypothetical protein
MPAKRTGERRRHRNAPASAAIRRDRSQARAAHSLRQARRPTRPTSRQESGPCRRDCCSSHRCRCSSASLRGRAERSFCPDNAARGLYTRDRQGVLRWNEILVLRKAPRRRQARDIERFLDEQRNAQEGPPLAHRQYIIGGARCIERTIEVAHTDCIQLRVEAFDSGDGNFRKFAGRNVPGRQRHRQFPDRLVFPVDVRHVHNRSRCQAMRSRRHELTAAIHSAVMLIRAIAGIEPEYFVIIFPAALRPPRPPPPAPAMRIPRIHARETARHVRARNAGTRCKSATTSSNEDERLATCARPACH